MIPSFYNLLQFFIGSYTLTTLTCQLFIPFFHSAFKNSAREFTPSNHQAKASTPTMGGLCILVASIACIIALALWGFTLNYQARIIVSSLLGFGAIGLFDDLMKLRTKRGISARLKWQLQLTLALATSIAITHFQGLPEVVVGLPVHVAWILFICWTIFIITGTSNAVNLTDGLDGLAGGVLAINFLFFSAIAIAQGNPTVAAICIILTGSVAGFLSLNRHPAKIFMGDVGSLSLGATLAVITILLRDQLLLPLTGIIFVLETMSVILQIFWIKKFKKKLFLFAPIHHHFEIKGWHEKAIVARAYLITIIFSAIAAYIYYFLF